MPVHRQPISVRELADAVGVEPAEFVAVERRPDSWYVVTEGRDMQTTGTCPPLSDNTSRKPKGKGKR